MDSWLLKLLPRDMKSKRKNKGEPTKNHKEITEKMTYNKKLQAMGKTLEWIFGCSNYFQETGNQKHKTKMNQ